MADIASVILKMNDIEIAADAPVTEALLDKIGANINALIDEDVALDVRIDALEAQVNNVSFGTAGTLAIATPISTAITTIVASTKVAITIQKGNTSGTNMSDSGAYTLKRNGVTIATWSASGTGNGAIHSISFTDFPNAAASTLLTYSFETTFDSGAFMRIVAEEVII